MYDVESRTLEEITQERIAILGPFLDLDPRTRARYIRGISAASNLSEETLRRWLRAYKEAGLEGLRPRKHRGVHVIPKEIVMLVARRRREQPELSLKKLVASLEEEGEIPKGMVKLSTLQNALERYGLTLSQQRARRERQQELGIIKRSGGD
ncbi:MAG: helix-turn-helix domain-containing protein [Bacillota bacterium]|nr:helix-turn-helix domain-containing protein [Bacillota bacterium]